MIYLIDTNVLLRFVDPTNASYPRIRGVMDKLWADGHHPQTTSQNFAEFWNVLTRPVHRNGLGRTPFEAEVLLRDLERLFRLLPDSPEVYWEWRRLVVNYNVSGVQVHDARLVATMIVHDVTHILTFNTRDFARYAVEGIVAVDPRSSFRSRNSL